MRDRLTEELISAYLDGELSDEERELVERTVAESDEHHQLLAELRKLHTGMQALPRFSLPADFHTRVVQEIDQNKPTPAERAPSAPRTRKRLAWRQVAGAAAALAVVVLLTFVIRTPPTPVDELDLRAVPRPVWMVELPKYVMVYDVTVTTSGQKSEAFDNLLKRLNIAIDPTLKLDAKLENDLLAIRQRNGGLPETNAVPYKQDETTPKSDEQDQVELIYISGKAGTIGDFGQGLEQLERIGEEVSRMHYDLVFEARKIKVLRRLHESAVNEFASGIDENPSVNGYAFKLVSAVHPGSTGFALPRLEDRAAATGGDASAAGLAAALSGSGLSSGDDPAGSKKAGEADFPKPIESPIRNEPGHVLVILRKIADKP
jgi:hypothetical protein